MLRKKGKKQLAVIERARPNPVSVPASSAPERASRPEGGRSRRRSHHYADFSDATCLAVIAYSQLSS